MCDIVCGCGCGCGCVRGESEIVGACMACRLCGHNVDHSRCGVNILSDIHNLACVQDWGILPKKPVVIGPIHKEQEMPGGGRGRPRSTVIYGKQLSLDVLLAEQKWHLALRDFRSKQRDIVHSGACV